MFKIGEKVILPTYDINNKPYNYWPVTINGYDAHYKVYYIKEFSGCWEEKDLLHIMEPNDIMKELLNKENV